MNEVLERLAMGKEKYGHGVRVEDDTTSWGTKKNSWMEMAREEFLDAVVYVIADYIRNHRGPAGVSQLEMNYILKNTQMDPDDNGLITYILEHWNELEPCRHKTLICTLLNILSVDQ